MKITLKRPVLFLTMAVICVLCVFFTDKPTQAYLSYGAVGTSVKQVQIRLKYLGYLDNADGLYGSATENAIKAFQRDRGLTPDGKCGNATMKALGLSTSLSYQQVIDLQNKLISLGYYSGNADGKYGAATANAVSEYQRDNALDVDGIAGKATLSSLEMNVPDTSQSEDDLYLLARMISAEARGESYTGQVAVGAVIMNRLSHPSFPDNIYDVLFQPGAFTAIADGQWDEPISDSAWSAARDAMSGIDPTGGAIYYYNPVTATSKWIRSRPVVATFGAHVFCT
ncbi:MAG: peptidoglycan-binding protein [Clostridia bacterium]|nr:peptidoglycan-binding protein [Clostridia bacterium]